MARRRTLTSTLYGVARISATGRAVRTGHAGRRAKNVVVGRNLGSRIEVQSGLSLSDRLIDNPLESTQPGDLVRVVAGTNAPAVAAAKTD